MFNTLLLPFQPDAMTPAQLAALTYLARYSGHTHHLYAYQLRPVVRLVRDEPARPTGRNPEGARGAVHPPPGRERAHAVFDQHDRHGVRGFFRLAHIDGLISADPAIYARLPTVHHDETRTQGLDRLELIRFLQVAQTVSVHHGALAYLPGIKALRDSQAAAGGSWTTRGPCAGTASSIWWARATSQPPCRLPSRSCAS